MTSVDRDLGRLEGKVDGITEQFVALNRKLDKLVSGDCVTGKANRHDIELIDTRLKKVEFTMAKAVAVAFIVAGGGASIIKAIESVLK